MEKIEITEEIIDSIQILIEKYNGIDNTSAITGISKGSLKKYLTKKVSFIAKYIWNDKLLPFMKSKNFEKISERIKLLEEDLNYYKNNYYDNIKKKFSEIDKLNEDTIKNLDKIIDNPVLFFNEHYINIDPFEDLNNFKKSILELKENREYCNYDLFLHMINFINIYEKFRPIKIEMYDAYWGTVKIMDEIFHTLYCYIGIRPFHTFSKINITQYKSKNIKYEEIDWNYLLKDIETVIDSVIKEIGKKAFDLIIKLRKHTPLYVERIMIEALIVRFEQFDRENIKFDFVKNTVVVNNIPIELDNYYNMINKIIKLTVNE